MKFMFESIRSGLFHWKMKKLVDCVYRDIFISKADDESYHIDYLILIGNKVLLVKYYNYNGNIFGSENISEWTQTIGHSGFKFYNPLREFKEIVTRVKDNFADYELVTYAMFSDKANFPKTMPLSVIKRENLLPILEGINTSGLHRDCVQIKQRLDLLLND